MEREILFRGKRIDNGEWMIGAFVPHWGTIERISGVGEDESHIVYSDSVGQYTGLTDKNGKRIFEGDIVLKRTYNGKKPFPVKFDGGMFYADIGGGSSTATHRYTLEDKQIEVIGNIHDNPELLET